MPLPNLLRKVFSRLTLGAFGQTSLLRRPCPAIPRFRPALEMLERRMMPSVMVNYTTASGTLVVDASVSNAANSPTSGYFTLINGTTLVINSGSAPATVFDVIQRSNLEPLTFGLGASTSGVGTVSIMAPGDTVTFNAVNITGSRDGITILGTGRGSGSGSYGVAVELGGLIQAGSTGAVSLVGQAPASTAALFFDNGNGSTLKVATGNVSLTGNIIDLGQANSIVSTVTSGIGHLAFQAYTHGRAIVVGSGSDAPNALTFTSTDLNAIAQGGTNFGFGLITIGSAGGANLMNLGAAISFSTNLSLEAHGG